MRNSTYVYLTFYSALPKAGAGGRNGAPRTSRSDLVIGTTLPNPSLFAIPSNLAAFPLYFGQSCFYHAYNTLPLQPILLGLTGATILVATYYCTFTTADISWLLFLISLPLENAKEKQIGTGLLLIDPLLPTKQPRRPTSGRPLPSSRPASPRPPTTPPARPCAKSSSRRSISPRLVLAHTHSHSICLDGSALRTSHYLILADALILYFSLFIANRSFTSSSTSMESPSRSGRL